MKSSRNGIKKTIKAEVIPTPGREEKPKKEPRKKLGLNSIFDIYNNIVGSANLQTFKNITISIVQSGLIVFPVVATIVDLTIGYTWSSMSIIHLLGSGCAYHIADDFIAKFLIMFGKR